MKKAIDLILLVALVVGAVLAWQTGGERSRLTERHRRLAQVTGDLPIADPSKVYILALDTKEPLHYAWRVHLPPNYKRILSDGVGGQSSGWSRDAEEFIARVRIREGDLGQLELYYHFSGGSTRMSFGNRSLADFLRGRWDAVRVEQLGSGDLAVIDPAGSAILLRLTIPESMRDEARRKLDSSTIERQFPVLLKLQLGPTAPKP